MYSMRNRLLTIDPKKLSMILSASNGEIIQNVSSSTQPKKPACSAGEDSAPRQWPSEKAIKNAEGKLKVPVDTLFATFAPYVPERVTLIQL